MAFYGNEFFQAVEGQPDDIALGYMRALWYYWNHNHCEGLKNDLEALRRICRIERDKWPEASMLIFGEFFKLDSDGLWQQDRARHEWDQAQKSYAFSLARAKKAANARWSR